MVYIVIMRNKKGQFDKGYTYRKPQPYWEKEWLFNEYISGGKSALLIAKEQKCCENNILFWLHKHKIKTRTTKEVRKIKYWGSPGKANSMYGKTGKLNPRWMGGLSAERQTKYARCFWKELAKSVLKRDGYKCQECGVGHTKNNRLVVHHIKQWSCYPELRFELNNLITVCELCHKKKHSRR